MTVHLYAILELAIIELFRSRVISHSGSPPDAAIRTWAEVSGIASLQELGCDGNI